jgi:4-carboxymuconolactone decarboxylase
VASLITANHQQQLAAHATKGRANGLTRIELGEVVTHLAFYAGWPPAFSAASIVEKALDQTTRSN